MSIWYCRHCDLLTGPVQGNVCWRCNGALELANMSQAQPTAKRKYDSTVARIAGNLLSGRYEHICKGCSVESDDDAAQWAVRQARVIVAEVLRTDPEAK